MKQFTLNADSWHFRLANYGRKRVSNYEVRHGTDFCTYMRAVVQGAFKALLTYTLFAVVLVWVGYGVYDLAMLAMDTERDIFPSTIFLFMVLATFLLLLCVALVGGSFNYVRERIQQRRWKSGNTGRVTPGFLTLAYRKFKDKTCFKIKFED